MCADLISINLHEHPVKVLIMTKLRFHFILFLIFIGFLFTPSFLNAQFGFLYADSIPVLKGGDTLEFPWAGGLNHAQFSSIDVNFDGQEDLFIFDRSSNQIQVFLTVEENGVKRYKYLYGSRQLFPEDVRYRAAMVDYNQDGKKDLFTYGIGGVKVYKNTGNATDGLQWELVSERLQSKYPSGNVSNLYISSTDIPAYVDVDGDSDIDILTYNIGGQRLEYHKNLSMENYDVPDSLEFEVYNECWGTFHEGNLDNQITLNSNLGPCGSPNIPNPQRSNQRHSGSTVLALDLNDDQVLDLILGDVSQHNLTALFNAGTAPNQNSPMNSKDVNFPSNTTPVDMLLFPASFYIDVNHDQVNDLIVTTNADGGSKNKESVWFYKNIGSNHQPNFIYQENDFLQKDMIENGKGSIPVLEDLDNDGLKDLLVASFYSFQPDALVKKSKIKYYKNTGTASAPVFTFISDDWLNLSDKGYGLRIHPAFGDMNNDGKKEMILGTQSGHLHLYKKAGNGPNDYTLDQLDLTDNTGTIINVNSFASPQLFDLNNNGLLDLIIGKRTSGIVYYENIGTPTNPSFKFITEDLGGIDMGTYYYPDNFSVPQFVRYNDTLHLFAGNRTGTIYYYDSINGNIADGDTFNLASDHYGNIDAAGYSAPCIDTLRDDHRYALFVGSDLGGVWAYTAEEFSEPILSVNDIEKLENQLTLFPNPSKNGIFTIQTMGEKRETSVEVYNTLGEKIKEIHKIWGTSQLDLSGFSQGVYTLVFKNRNQPIFTKRVVIQH